MAIVLLLEEEEEEEEVSAANPFPGLEARSQSEDREGASGCSILPRKRVLFLLIPQPMWGPRGGPIANELLLL